MIVNIAGWVYLIQAVLLLCSMAASPFGMRMTLANLATLLASVLAGFIGYGLLKRDSRARWWALGSSLISWVIGGLLILIGIGVLLYVATTDRGSGGGSFDMARMLFTGAAFIVMVFFVFVFGLFIAVTVIMYKLFWHLCSREGCEEFGVEYGSAGTVLASVGAWIGLTILQVWMTAASLTGSGFGSMMARERVERPDVARQIEQEAARQEARAAIQREEERQRAALLEEAEQALAESQENERLRAEVPNESYDSASQYVPPAAESGEMESEAAAPVFGGNEGDRDEEERKPNQILKCRDGSGAISYTQGYCPPGTTLVDTPQFE